MANLRRTTTTTALLDALLNSEDEAIWTEFDGRYRPIITGFAMRLGLPPTDAADIAQETLLQFLRDYRCGKYDRSRGRLGAWVIGIARHRVYDLKRAQVRRRERRGESAIVDLPDEGRMTRIWDEECRQAILKEALAKLRETTRTDPKTIDAFVRHVIDRQPPETVARELGMSVQAVYLAKHRCLARLRTIVEELEGAYEVN